MNKIRKELEKPMPYKWRVQSVSFYEPVASCIAYVDSRLVRDRLTDVFGVAGWQDKFYSVNGSMVCEISCKIGSEWISKSDVGEPSAISAKKGESSDSFKRAAVKWGVGRFIYDLDIIKLDTDGQKVKGSKNKIYVMDGHKKVYDLTEFVNNLEFNSIKNMKKCDKDSIYYYIAISVLKMVDFDYDRKGDALYQAQALLTAMTGTNRKPLGFSSFREFYKTKSTKFMNNAHDKFFANTEMLVSSFENSDKGDDV